MGRGAPGDKGGIRTQLAQSEPSGATASPQRWLTAQVRLVPNTLPDLRSHLATAWPSGCVTVRV